MVSHRRSALRSNYLDLYNNGFWCHHSKWCFRYFWKYHHQKSRFQQSSSSRNSSSFRLHRVSLGNRSYVHHQENEQLSLSFVHHLRNHYHGRCNPPLGLSQIQHSSSLDWILYATFQNVSLTFRSDVLLCWNVLHDVGNCWFQYCWTHEEVNYGNNDRVGLLSWKYHGTTHLHFHSGTRICRWIYWNHNLHYLCWYCCTSGSMDVG